MSGATNNPIFQQLQLLMTGYGYNFYGKREMARADDLLVRERASETLAEAVAAITGQEEEFVRRFIPPASRENPYPPPETMIQLKDIGRHKEKVKDLSVRIRSMSVPTQDKTWLRFRDEVPLLQQLLQFDYNLIAGTAAMRDIVAGLTADGWKDGSAASQIAPGLADLDKAIKARQAFLQIPAY